MTTEGQRGHRLSWPSLDRQQTSSSEDGEFETSDQLKALFNTSKFLTYHADMQVMSLLSFRVNRS
jgi:hypothetical protein